MTRAPGKRTADSSITRSLILSAIEAGATYAQAARDAGVSPARARQVAKEAGLPARHPGGLRSEAVTTRTTRGAAILARVVDLAAAAGVEPEAWLGDAAWTLAAHARAAAELDHLAAHGSPAERAVAGSVRRLICGAPSNVAAGTAALLTEVAGTATDMAATDTLYLTFHLRNSGAKVVELAAAAGETPADWLEDAARCRKACEEIVYILEGLPRNDGASPWTCEQLLKLAIGPTDPAQVRADALKETP